MVDVWTVVNIVITSVPILGYLISIYFLLKSRKIHPFVGLMWAIGFVTAIAALVLAASFENKNFGTTWFGFVLIFLLASGQGVLYFMVAFEFYTSATTMEEILMNKPPMLTKK
jgi:hypothetical protein